MASSHWATVYWPPPARPRTKLVCGGAALSREGSGLTGAPRIWKPAGVVASDQLSATSLLWSRKRPDALRIEKEAD